MAQGEYFTGDPIHRRQDSSVVDLTMKVRNCAHRGSSLGVRGLQRGCDAMATVAGTTA